MAFHAVCAGWTRQLFGFVAVTFVPKGLIVQPDRVLRIAVSSPDLFGLIETTSQTSALAAVFRL